MPTTSESTAQTINDQAPGPVAVRPDDETLERMRATIWRDEAARLRLETWYERFQSRIEVPVESHTVPTRHGPSHVLLAGSAQHTPLVCLHAMRTSSAHLLSEIGPLLGRFRVIAPDLPGQSVRGPQVRLPLSDDALARWLFDVLDALDVGEAHFFGVSWGGFAARLAASTDPKQVRRLALLVGKKSLYLSASVVACRRAVGYALHEVAAKRERLRGKRSEAEREAAGECN